MPSPRTRFAAVALLISLAGCGGGDSTGPGATPPSVVATLDSLHPGDPIVLTIAGTELPSGPVAGALGGDDLTFTPVGGGVIAAFVPELAAGPATLSLSLPDTTVAIPLTILAPLTIADPVASIGAVLDAQLARLDGPVPEGMDSVSWTAQRALLDSLVADAKSGLGELSDAERLQAARWLSLLLDEGGVPMVAAAPGTSAACAAAETSSLKAVYHASVAGSAMLLAIPVGVFSERLKNVLGVTASTAIAEMRVQLTGRNAKCQVQRRVQLSGIGVRGAPALSAMTAGPDRFFQGYRMLYRTTGGFRPVSRDELATDPLLAAVDGAYRGVVGMLDENLGKFPSWMQGAIGALPASIAETPPGAIIDRPLAPESVQVAAISPSSIHLTAGTEGEFLTLTATGSVANDVPFTYDLVALADADVRKSVSAVQRPMMAASFGASGLTFEGERTVVNIGGVNYGQLTCGGSRVLKVTGGDKGVWQEFQWVESSSKYPPDSSSQALTPTEFEAGEHTFSGSWWSRWNEGGTPQYIPFTIGLRVSYIDKVSNTLKYSSEFWFSCQ